LAVTRVQRCPQTQSSEQCAGSFGEVWRVKRTEYVLDTHALVFALTAPSKLGVRALKAFRGIESGRDTAWIPAAVAAEITLLHELGRIQIGLTELKDVMEDSSSLRFLPLDFGQICDFAALGGIHEAFDRFVVAAALSLGAKLITRESSIIEAKLVQTVWS
jgi:PIN domain nuclease of toxin-antitoxin system